MLAPFYIEQIFNDVVFRYKELFGFDLSHMKMVPSEQPRYEDGSICKEFSPEETGGSWAKNGIVYINPNPDKVIEHWKLDMSVDDFLTWIIAHELGHEIWKKTASQTMKDEVLRFAKEHKFSTKYLETVSKKKKDEETFCEFLASLLSDTP